MRVGRGAVIGMGAVVTKDVPAGAMVVGNDQGGEVQDSAQSVMAIRTPCGSRMAPGKASRRRQCQPGWNRASPIRQAVVLDEYAHVSAPTDQPLGQVRADEAVNARDQNASAANCIGAPAVFSCPDGRPDARPSGKGATALQGTSFTFGQRDWAVAPSAAKADFSLASPGPTIVRAYLLKRPRLGMDSNQGDLHA